MKDRWMRFTCLRTEVRTVTRLFQTSTSASRRPAASAPPAWTKSTLSAASVQQEEPARAAKKVKPAAATVFTTVHLTAPTK